MNAVAMLFTNGWVKCVTDRFKGLLERGETPVSLQMPESLIVSEYCTHISHHSAAWLPWWRHICSVQWCVTLLQRLLPSKSAPKSAHQLLSRIVSPREKSSFHSWAKLLACRQTEIKWLSSVGMMRAGVRGKRDGTLKHITHPQGLLLSALYSLCVVKQL